MDRKVQKVINKLIKQGDSHLKCFNEEKNKNLHLLVKSILLLQFNQVHFDDNILADDKSDVDILFLDPSKVFSTLEEIYTNSKEQVAFLEWYLNRMVRFFTTKPLEHYEKMGEILADKINTYLGIMKKSNTKNDKKEITYAKYKTICEKMKKLYQVGILYTQQYELLLSLGMSQEMINQIKNYQVSSLLESCNTPKIDEVEKQEENKEKSTHSKVLENTMKQENSISHRIIKNELNEYLDLSNLQNKVLIEGDVFLKVDELLRKIYPEIKVAYLEKRINANNEKMKQKMYTTAMQELLPDENNYQLFCEAKKSLHNELKNDSFFSPYPKLVQNIVTEVEKYLYSYLLLSDTDKENLKEDYVNLIAMCLDELRLHLDFLPFYEKVR